MCVVEGMRVRLVLESERVLVFATEHARNEMMREGQGQGQGQRQCQDQGRGRVRGGPRAKRASLQAQKHIKSVKRRRRGTGEDGRTQAL
jgi:hypothetical protein